MRFWIRELAGWALVLLGLFAFFLTYAFLTEHYVWEAGQWMVVGIVVFRGGIHLLKVAVAARVCTLALDEMSVQRAAPPARPIRLPPRVPARAQSGAE